MECCLAGVLHQAGRLLPGRLGACDRMSVGASRMKGRNAAVLCALHENLRHRLPCLFQAGSGRKLKHFGVIERVFHPDGLAGVRGRGRVRLGDGLGSLIGGRRHDFWNRRYGCRCLYGHWRGAVIAVMSYVCYRNGRHGHDADDSCHAQRQLPKGLAQKSCTDIRNARLGSSPLYRHRRFARGRRRRCR